MPLATPRALSHRWLPARGRRPRRRGGRARARAPPAPVATRRSSCARVVPRIHTPPRDAAACAGAGPAAQVGLGLGARSGRAEPTKRVECEREHSAGAGCVAESQCEQWSADGAGAQPGERRVPNGGAGAAAARAAGAGAARSRCGSLPAAAVQHAAAAAPSTTSPGTASGCAHAGADAGASASADAGASRATDADHRATPAYASVSLPANSTQV